MARRFARRRWRRPERMTLEHPPVVRRKDLAVPELLTLEIDVARRDNARLALVLQAAFIGFAVLEFLIAGVFLKEWYVAVVAAAGLLFLVAERAFGAEWLRHALGAQLMRAPKVHRLVRKIADAAGIEPPDVYVIRGEQPNAIAFGGSEPWIGLTTPSFDLEDVLLEAVIAHEIVHIRDGEAEVAWRYVSLAGAPDLALRVWRAQFGVAGWLGVGLWPASLLLRTLRRYWLPESREHRADVAAALLTRYPPALAEALTRARGASAQGLGVMQTLWFAPTDHQRSRLVAEM